VERRRPKANRPRKLSKRTTSIALRQSAFVGLDSASLGGQEAR